MESTHQRKLIAEVSDRSSDGSSEGKPSITLKIFARIPKETDDATKERSIEKESQRVMADNLSAQENHAFSESEKNSQKKVRRKRNSPSTEADMLKKQESRIRREHLTAEGPDPFFRVESKSEKISPSNLATEKRETFDSPYKILSDHICSQQQVGALGEAIVPSTHKTLNESEAPNSETGLPSSSGDESSESLVSMEVKSGDKFAGHENEDQMPSQGKSGKRRKAPKDQSTSPLPETRSGRQRRTPKKLNNDFVVLGKRKRAKEDEAEGEHAGKGVKIDQKENSNKENIFGSERGNVSSISQELLEGEANNLMAEGSPAIVDGSDVAVEKGDPTMAGSDEVTQKSEANQPVISPQREPQLEVNSSKNTKEDWAIMSEETKNEEGAESRKEECDTGEDPSNLSPEIPEEEREQMEQQQLLEMINNPLEVDFFPKISEEKRKQKGKSNDPRDDTPPLEDNRLLKRKSRNWRSINMNRRVVLSTFDDGKQNREVCESCKGTGDFVCCETCPSIFHFYCAEPFVDPENLPEGIWQCNQCLSKKKSPKKMGTIFGAILNKVMNDNPVTFALPEGIQNYFEDVSPNPDSGAYRENFKKPAMKKKFKNSIFCHACRGTQIKAPLYGCDYCALSWHLDCVDPPLPHPPNPAAKWMCPSHADHYLSKQRRKRKGQPELEDEELPYRVEIEKEQPFQTIVLDGKQHILPEKAVKIKFLERIVRERILEWEQNHQEQQEIRREAFELLNMAVPAVIMPFQDSADAEFFKASPEEQTQYLEAMESFQKDLISHLKGTKTSENKMIPAMTPEGLQERIRKLDQQEIENLAKGKNGIPLSLLPLPATVTPKYVQFLAWQILQIQD